MTRWQRLAVLALLPFPAFFALDAAFPLRVEVPWSTRITDRDGTLLYAALAEDGQWRFRAGLDEYPPAFLAALVAKEDGRFYRHPGVDPIAVLRAAWTNAVRGRRVSGASTIPMQVARMLDPGPRTPARKAVEAFRALQLDYRYPKDELLALYVNLLPYGGNVRGAATAARCWLGKEARNLSPGEMAAFAVLPNDPEGLRPDRHPDALARERDRWLEAFARQGLFSDADRAAGLAESTAWRRRPFPREAPHLALRLMAAHPGRGELRSTLDADRQREARTLLQRAVERWRPYGIHNGCVLVLDNATAEVRVYLGSADFGDATDGGQVDGLRALRSPGSTLKPWLFALALDSGLITPRMPLLDVPVDLDGWRPENYDHTFSGRVPARDALARSLNVPAVRLLDAYGVEAFGRRLSRAGLRSLDGQPYGPALVLGGCGVRPDELAAAYAALAHGGRYREPRYLLTDAPAPERPVLGAEAAWLVGQMLTRPDRPDLPLGLHQTEDLPRIAWKTGTSYGRRDAWTVGFNRRHTILVWTGNFSGHGVPELTGAGVAAPLLFELFRVLDAGGADWPASPPGLRMRLVCPESGLPPGPRCPEAVTDAALPLVSPATPCRHLQPILVSADSTVRHCLDCAPADGTRRAWWPVPDPDWAAWMRAEGRPFDAPPPHDPGCTRVFGGQAPRVTSPSEGLVYHRVPGAGRIPLQCVPGADADRVWWYADGRLLGEAAAGADLFWTPTAGRHELTVADDRGRRRSVTVTVVGP